MKSVPREIKTYIKTYVEFVLERGRDFYPNELNEYLATEWGVSIVDPELLQELIVQAKKDIGFVYLIKEEEA